MVVEMQGKEEEVGATGSGKEEEVGAARSGKQRGQQGGGRQQRQRHRCATTAGSRGGATVHRRGRRSGRQQQSRGGRKRAATVRRGLWQRESSGVRPVAIVVGRRKMRLRVAVVRTATVDGRRQWPWPARDTAAADGRRQFFGGDGSGWWQRSRVAGDKGGDCGKEVVTVGCSGSDNKEAAAEKKGEEQRCRRQMREERKIAQRAYDYCDRKGRGQWLRRRRPTAGAREEEGGRCAGGAAAVVEC
ncbi:hypothetical protein B296_00023151 [Ensete ventricosum]|uniref:Uncharacterized protein n=1 Tax=Ensete ventricosum TaxID=4639 RepID=A0A426X7G4_ENSVE|nr:hypothetical protein B296_00023151 [Ensete ventricosum]